MTMIQGMDFEGEGLPALQHFTADRATRCNIIDVAVTS